MAGRANSFVFEVVTGGEMGHSCFDVSFTLMGIIDFFGFPKEMG